MDLKIKVEKWISRASIFTKQMKEPLIIILLVAIIISAFVGDLVDAIIIIAIVILSILVGFIGVPVFAGIFIAIELQLTWIQIIALGGS